MKSPALALSVALAMLVVLFSPAGTRIRVCVDLCCLTDFHALVESRGLDEHGVYYYVPSLLQHFTTAGIVALFRPQFQAPRFAASTE